MKLISWNVNGLRACLTHDFAASFAALDADIFSVQETKMQPGQADFAPEGYTEYTYSAEKKGYSGTACWCKTAPLAVTTGIGREEHDHEGRVLTLEYPGFYLVNCYTPNSQDGLKRLDYRMTWEDAFRAYLLELDAKKPVILCGDLNVAHTEIDIKNARTNRMSAGFTDQERAKMTELLAAGFAAYRFWWLPRAGFAVHFVDIGQGDAAIVVCDGKTLVIDGGMPESSARLVDYLQNTLHVSTIDAMIGTHPHADHIGGLPDVIRAFAVKTLYSPVDEFEGKPFEAMKRAADAKNVRITVPQAGQRFSLGRAEVEFYAPLGIYDDVNDLSLVTRITYGQTAFLFTGDAERPSENDMIDSDEALSATVLKVGHHGSNTSSSYLFLRQVMPSYAVISCGRDNAYGHPHQEVLARLRDIGAAVYRTDESGTIVCRSNGERVAFETEKGKKPTATPRKGQSVGYIGNIKSKKFHLSTCSSVQDIQQSNRITFATRAAAVKQGYSPCKACRP